jgi:hypothetical protein
VLEGDLSTHNWSTPRPELIPQKNKGKLSVELPAKVCVHMAGSSHLKPTTIAKHHIELMLQVDKKKTRGYERRDIDGNKIMMLEERRRDVGVRTGNSVTKKPAEIRHG